MHNNSALLWPLDGSSKSTGKLEHSTWVQSVTVDGDLAATGGGDGMVRLWSLSNLTCLKTLNHCRPVDSGTKWTANPQPVFSVRLRKGVLVSGGQDHGITVWALTDDAEFITRLTHGANVRGLSISSKGFIASSGGTLKKLIVWHPAPGT